MNEQANRLWVLDFDRCLGNLIALNDHMIRIANTVGGLEADKIRESQMQTELAGGSFDTLGYIQSAVPGIDFRRIIEAFEKRDEMENDRFLEPTVRDFLTWLEKSEQPYMIMSYGGSLWQTLKIVRAGLAGVPRIIVPTPSKSDVLADWKARDGQFLVPLKTIVHGEQLKPQYSELVLVDDKKIAFQHLPEGVRGYWVRARKTSMTEPYELEDSVTSVNRMYEITSHEK